MTIYKYPIEITDVQSVNMPINSEILTAQMQGESLCLWAKVEEHNTSIERRIIEVVGTGNPLNPDSRYIATVQTPPFVWHVFERM